MTKKTFLPLLSLLLLLATLPLQAQTTRSEADALAIADAFFPKSRGGENVEQTLAHTERDSATNHAYYYVFNRGNDQGWIIICADGRTKSILGYSDTGHYDTESAPPEMKAWLTDYSSQIRDLSVTPDEVLKNLDKYVLSKARSKGSQSFANAVKPLLGDIQYGQNFPYNIMTPVYYGQNSVTGCVATAIVQIMRYWKYPKKPTGKSHTYNLYGQDLGMYFNTYYDWDNILPTYNGNIGNDRQNSAVAKLMVDVGIASDMTYSPSQSAADPVLASSNLTEFFDYDPNMIVYKRADFDDATFVYFLKRELNAGRPVIFSGYGGGSGHCFVCDGYDSNGLFHINWGWDGMCDGYYSITNLVPAQAGTGGGYGRYNDNIHFTGGVRPNMGKGRRTWLMRMQNMYYPQSATVGQQSTFSMMKLENKTTQTMSGYAGMGLFNDGKLVSIIGYKQFGKLKIQSWWNQIDVPVTWPSSLQSGNYQLVAMFKADGEDRWRAVANRTTNSYDVTVSGRSIRITPNTKYTYSDLEDNAFDISPDGYEQGVKEYEEENTTNPVITSPLAFNSPVRSGNITARAELTSRGSYQGKMGVFLYDSEYKECVATLQAKTVSVRDKKIKVDFNGVVQLEPGTYGAAIFYTDREGKWILVPERENSCVTFTVKEPESIVLRQEPILPLPDDDNVLPGGDDNVQPDDDGNVQPDDDDNVQPDDDEYEYYDDDNDLGDMTDDDDWDIDDDYWSYNDDDDDEDDSWESDDYDDYYDDSDSDGNYSFLDFALDVISIFAKSSDPNEPFKVEAMQFTKAKPETRDGMDIYSFRIGQEEVLNATIINTKDTQHRRILTVSLFDENNNWVADVSESFVIVPAKGSKSVRLPLQFTDVPPGPYRLCLTENANELSDSRQMQPQNITQMLIQIKR